MPGWTRESFTTRIGEGAKNVVNARSGQVPTSARAPEPGARTFGRAATWSTWVAIVLFAIFDGNTTTTWFDAGAVLLGIGATFGLLAFGLTQPRRERLLDFLADLAILSLLAAILRRVL